MLEETYQTILTEAKQASSDLEKIFWMKLLADKWFLEAPVPVQKQIVRTPPFYLYRTKTKGALVTIKEYKEKKDDDNPTILIVVSLHPDWNPQLLYERMILGVPEEELERVDIVEIARIKQVQARMQGLPWMQRLINTRDRSDVKRGNDQNAIKPTAE